MRILGAFLGVVASVLSQSSFAALVIDESLGVLSFGSHSIVGSTVGAGNEADRYANTTSTTGNWGNDYVYQFELPQLSLVNLTLNSSVGDPDFFFLTSTATSPQGGKEVATDDIATSFLDGGTPMEGNARMFNPGTYLLSVDSFIGFDGGVSSQDALFDVDITLSLPTDLGIFAGPNESFSFDTFGSTYDTVLVLWNSDGDFLAFDDDTAGVQSEIDLPAGLAAGDYYLGVGGFGHEFADGFFVGTGANTAFGDYTLNFPTGSTSGTTRSDEVHFYKFAIGAVPEPGSCSLGVMGLALILRRKRVCIRGFIGE